MTFRIDILTEKYMNRSIRVGHQFQHRAKTNRSLREFCIEQTKRVNEYNEKHPDNRCEQGPVLIYIRDRRNPFTKVEYNATIPRGFPLLDTRMQRGKDFERKMKELDKNNDLSMLEKCNRLLEMAGDLGVQFLDFFDTVTCCGRSRKVPYRMFETFPQFLPTPDKLVNALNGYKKRAIEDANHLAFQTMLEFERMEDTRKENMEQLSLTPDMRQELERKYDRIKMSTYIMAKRNREVIEKLVGKTLVSYNTVKEIIEDSSPVSYVELETSEVSKAIQGQNAAQRKLFMYQRLFSDVLFVPFDSVMDYYCPQCLLGSNSKDFVVGSNSKDFVERKHNMHGEGCKYYDEGGYTGTDIIMFTNPLRPNGDSEATLQQFVIRMNAAQDEVSGTIDVVRVSSGKKNSASSGDDAYSDDDFGGDGFGEYSDDGSGDDEPDAVRKLEFPEDVPDKLLGTKNLKRVIAALKTQLNITQIDAFEVGSAESQNRTDRFFRLYPTGDIVDDNDPVKQVRNLFAAYVQKLLDIYVNIRAPIRQHERPTKENEYLRDTLFLMETLKKNETRLENLYNNTKLYIMNKEPFKDEQNVEPLNQLLQTTSESREFIFNTPSHAPNSLEVEFTNTVNELKGPWSQYVRDENVEPTDVIAIFMDEVSTELEAYSEVETPLDPGGEMDKKLTDSIKHLKKQYDYTFARRMIMSDEIEKLVVKKTTKAKELRSSTKSKKTNQDKLNMIKQMLEVNAVMHALAEILVEGRKYLAEIRVEKREDIEEDNEDMTDNEDNEGTLILDGVMERAGLVLDTEAGYIDYEQNGKYEQKRDTEYTTLDNTSVGKEYLKYLLALQLFEDVACYRVLAIAKEVKKKKKAKDGAPRIIKTTRTAIVNTVNERTKKRMGEYKKRIENFFKNKDEKTKWSRYVDEIGAWEKSTHGMHQNWPGICKMWCAWLNKFCIPDSNIQKSENILFEADGLIENEIINLRNTKDRLAKKNNDLNTEVETLKNTIRTKREQRKRNEHNLNKLKKCILVFLSKYIDYIKQYVFKAIHGRMIKRDVLMQKCKIILETYRQARLNESREGIKKQEWPKRNTDLVKMIDRALKLNVIAKQKKDCNVDIMMTIPQMTGENMLDGIVLSKDAYVAKSRLATVKPCWSRLFQREITVQLWEEYNPNDFISLQGILDKPNDIPLRPSPINKFDIIGWDLVTAHKKLKGVDNEEKKYVKLREQCVETFKIIKPYLDDYIFRKARIDLRETTKNKVNQLERWLRDILEVYNSLDGTNDLLDWKTEFRNLQDQNEFLDATFTISDVKVEQSIPSSDPSSDIANVSFDVYDVTPETKEETYRQSLKGIKQIAQSLYNNAKSNTNIKYARAGLAIVTDTINKNFKTQFDMYTYWIREEIEPFRSDVVNIDTTRNDERTAEKNKFLAQLNNIKKLRKLDLFRWLVNGTNMQETDTKQFQTAFYRWQAEFHVWKKFVKDRDQLDQMKPALLKEANPFLTAADNNMFAERAQQHKKDEEEKKIVAWVKTYLGQSDDTNNDASAAPEPVSFGDLVDVLHEKIKEEDAAKIKAQDAAKTTNDDLSDNGQGDEYDSDLLSDLEDDGDDVDDGDDGDDVDDVDDDHVIDFADVIDSDADDEPPPTLNIAGLNQLLGKREQDEERRKEQRKREAIMRKTPFGPYPDEIERMMIEDGFPLVSQPLILDPDDLLTVEKEDGDNADVSATGAQSTPDKLKDPLLLRIQRDRHYTRKTLGSAARHDPSGFLYTI